MASKFDLAQALIDNGFVKSEHPLAQHYNEDYAKQMFVLSKTYSKTIDLAWHGLQEVQYTVTARFYPGGVTVWFGNGKVKDYAQNKRTYNAIVDTIHYAGFEF